MTNDNKRAYCRICNSQFSLLDIFDDPVCDDCTDIINETLFEMEDPEEYFLSKEGPVEEPFDERIHSRQH